MTTLVQQVAATNVPRGVRLCNPLNIRRGAGWRGLAPFQSDPQFCEFVEPIYGIRAAARILWRYFNDHNIRTLTGVIQRWAPPDENDTDAYIDTVVRVSSYPIDTIFPMMNQIQLVRLIPAMMIQEIGNNPYEACVIADGIALALVKDELRAHKAPTIIA